MAHPSARKSSSVPCTLKAKDTLRYASLLTVARSRSGIAVYFGMLVLPSGKQHGNGAHDRPPLPGNRQCILREM